jgi:hypothetical protein
MRRFGFLLVTIGFLGGALASVLSEDAVHWEPFAVVVAVGFAGVVLVRTSQRREKRAVERLSSNMQAIEESLRRVVENVTRLNEARHNIDPYDIRHRIDELFVDDLNTFIGARESIAHSYGLRAYGDVMNCFAAGERYLSRVWCASADGYVDEINEYLDRAKEQFAAGLDKVLNLHATAPPARP